MSYPGGKGFSNAASEIITPMPRHDFYCEPFAGSGRIFLTKKPAEINLAIDLDPKALMKINALDHPEATWIQNNCQFETLQFCAIEWLQNLPNPIQNGMMLYLDPPYLPSTLHQINGRGRQRYKYRFGVESHIKLLEIITELKCFVMISGYKSKLYNNALCAPKWTQKSFMAQTRRGMKEETLWMNFDPRDYPDRHDYRFLGANYRTREVWKKRRETILRKFTKLDTLEKRAMIEILQTKIEL